MAALALAEALPDFSRSPRTAPAADAAPPVFVAPAPPVPLRPEEPTLEQRIAAAEEALRATLAAGHEAERAAQRERHAQEIAALEARMGSEVAAMVDSAFARAEERLVQITGSVTARILGLALSETLEKRSVEALVATIRETLADGETVRIVLSGAPHLCEAVRTALGDRAENLECHESEALDLTVSIDDHVLETRLSEWSQALAGILA